MAGEQSIHSFYGRAIYCIHGQSKAHLPVTSLLRATERKCSLGSFAFMISKTLTLCIYTYWVFPYRAGSVCQRRPGPLNNVFPGPGSRNGAGQKLCLFHVRRTQANLTASDVVLHHHHISQKEGCRSGMTEIDLALGECCCTTDIHTPFSYLPL
ncbi:hypothetical protein GGR57DRAFT_315233 [Xylariaceae sp. FL1272]|nr:hypothetical protein GGR57DRAFT_315233 [Xylariaceae sp. FL1272]